MLTKSDRAEVVMCLQELSGIFPTSPNDTFKIKICFWDSVQETREVQIGPSGKICFEEDISWSLKLSTLVTLLSRLAIVQVTVLKNGVKIGSLFVDLRDALPLPSGTSRTDFIRRKWQVSHLLDAKKDPTSDDHPSIKWLLTIENYPQLKNQVVQSAPRAAAGGVMLDKELGIFFVGSNCTQVFQISIEIYYASHLDLAVEKEGWNPSGTNDDLYYLSYDFLGETVITQTFRNLRRPDFNAEEAVFSVKSSFGDITRYLSQVPPFAISVCSSGNELTKNIFSIRDILKPKEAALREKSALNGSIIQSFKNSQDSVIGVMISLKTIKNHPLNEVGAEPPQMTLQDIISAAFASSEIQEGGNSATQSILRNSTNELPSLELSERERETNASLFYATPSGQQGSSDESMESTIERLKDKIKDLEMQLAEKDKEIQELKDKCTMLSTSNKKFVEEISHLKKQLQ